VELTGIEREEGGSSDPEKMAESRTQSRRTGSEGPGSRSFTSGSRSFAPSVAELEAAIANVTRALATALGDDVVVLARVWDAMSRELRELAAAPPTNVIPFNHLRR
jgi:hypothetical protein